MFESIFKFYKICALLHRSKLNILAKNRVEKSALFVKCQFVFLFKKTLLLVIRPYPTYYNSKKMCLVRKESQFDIRPRASPHPPPAVIRPPPLQFFFNSFSSRKDTRRPWNSGPSYFSEAEMKFIASMDAVCCLETTVRWGQEALFFLHRKLLSTSTSLTTEKRFSGSGDCLQTPLQISLQINEIWKYFALRAALY